MWTKVFFFVSVALLGGASSNAAPAPRKTQLDSVRRQKFFVEAAEDCDENSTLLQYMFDRQKRLSRVEFDQFSELMSGAVEVAALPRLDNTISPSNQRRRRRRHLLAESDAVSRRDQVVALLNLVVLSRGNTTKTQLSKRALQEAAPTTRYLDKLNIDIVDNTLLPGDELFEFAKALPCLKYPPEFDAPRHASRLGQPQNVSGQFPADYLIPNDPFSVPGHPDSQWFLRGVDDHLTNETVHGSNFYKAWKRYRGETGAMVVGVVDSGCSFHPDVVDNLCRDNDDCAGYDFGDDKADSSDEPLRDVHGTPISGIIAGSTDNEMFTAGLCWKCRIMCLKVYNKQAGSLMLSASVAAMNYMLKKNVKLSNHSYVGYSYSAAEYSAIKKLQEAGHLLVVAAGNHNCDLDKPSYINDPTCTLSRMPNAVIVPLAYNLPNVLSVGSTDENGRLSSFSNYGKQSVDIFAPGSSIVSIYNTQAAWSGLVRMSGTSLSTAIVTGLIALLWSSKPELSYDEILFIVMGTARRLPHLQGQAVVGGIVDAAAALDMADGLRDEERHSLLETLIETQVETSGCLGCSLSSVRAAVLCVFLSLAWWGESKTHNREFQSLSSLHH